MTMNEELIAKVDRNNAKARAIIDGLIHGIENDQDDLDVLALLEAAFDYLDGSNEIFKANM